MALEIIGVDIARAIYIVLRGKKIPEGATIIVVFHKATLGRPAGHFVCTEKETINLGHAGGLLDALFQDRKWTKVLETPDLTTRATREPKTTVWLVEPPPTPEEMKFLRLASIALKNKALDLRKLIDVLRRDGLGKALEFLMPFAVEVALS